MRRRAVPLALQGVLLSVAFASGIGGAGAAPAGHAYLVMPFENTAEDPSLEWLSTGLALSLGEYLSGLGAQVVDEDERAVLLEGNGIPPGARFTLASALELGRKMRARPGSTRPDRLVLGRFNVTGGDLTLSTRSLEIAEEKARPWIARQGRLKSLLVVQNALAQALAKGDGLPINESRSEILARQAGDLPLLAFEHYCRAMAEPDAKKRLQLLRRAAQEVPGYPKAGYQAAALLVKAERWDEASEMLAKVAVEPHPYEAGFYLLTAAIALQKRDPEAAAGAARKALERADSARGHALLGRALAARGDREAAQGELQKAATIDASEPEIDDLRRALAEGARPARRNP